MSNYIFGCLHGSRHSISSVADIVNGTSKNAPLKVGFHALTAGTPKAEYLGFPIQMPLVNCVSEPPKDCELDFCISDDAEGFTSSYLIDEYDWPEENETFPDSLPLKLSDRLELIVQLVHLLFEETGCFEVDLWISVTDLLEDVTEVPLPLFGDKLRQDFDERGIPCVLYKITL